MPLAIDPFRVVDLSSLTNMDDAAKFAVFHHPDLLTLDSNVREKVLGYIEAAPAYPQLMQALGQQGVAQGPDSDYEGWTNGAYLVDAQGNQIPDGKGGYLWTYRHTSDTLSAMRPVIGHTVAAVRNDSSLAGIRFEQPVTASPAADAAIGGFVTDYQSWVADARLRIDSVVGSTVNVEVANRQFRYLGAFARFLDAQGAAIGSPSHLGYVPPRPLILGAALSADTTSAFAVPMPASTHAIELIAASFGRGNLASVFDNYGNVVVPGTVLSVLLCSVLPALYVASGAVASQDAITQLISYLQTFAARPAVAQLIESFASTTRPDVTNTELAYAVLAAVLNEKSTALDGVVASLGTQRLNDLIPIAGCVLEAIAAGDNMRQPPWAVSLPIRSTVDLRVDVLRDVNSYQLPAGARRCQITANAVTAQASVLSPSMSTASVTITGLSSIHPVEAMATVLDSRNAVVGEGRTWLQSPLSGAASIRINEAVVSLTAASQYTCRQTLRVGVDGTHTWDTSGTPPSATQAQLGGNMAVTLEGLTFLTITATGRLGYGWRARSPTSAFTMQGISVTELDAQRHTLANGFTTPVLLALDGTASSTLNFAVVPAVNPRSKQTEYHLRHVDLAATNGFDLVNALSWGRFSSTRLDSAAVHPSGVVVALCAATERLEILRVPASAWAQDDQADYALQAGGQGSGAGQLHGAQAVAGQGWEERFFVLEKTNARVQAFDLQGNPLALFGALPFFSLSQWAEDNDKAITWIDLKVSPAGYFFILSLENEGSSPAQYRLDVYTPDGAKLSRSRGLAAACIAVDRSNVVYTLNYELQVGANRQPEPSVSLWTLS